MTSISLRRHLAISILLLSVVMGSNVYSQDVCGNDLHLLSKVNNEEERSVEVKIVSNNNFTCTILYFERGEFVKLKEVSGNAESKIKFENLRSDRVYRVVAEFENETMFCRSRQIGGISL